MRRPRSSKNYFLLTLAGLFFAGDLSFWHWSIKLTSIANSTLPANFAPIFITLGGFCFFGERFTNLFLTGMALALVGASLLFGDSLIFGRANIIGDVLGLLAALFYGAYLMTVSRLRIHFSTATIMTWSGTVACIFVIPITLILEANLLALTLTGWLVFLALALVPQLCGQSLIAFSLAHLPAAFGSVGLMLQPVIAAIIA